MPLPALLLLLIAGAQEPTRITFPKAATETGLAADVLAWEGFRYAGASRETFRPFRAPGDWKGIVAGPDPSAGVVWRTKVFLLTKSDATDEVRGALVPRRAALEETDAARAVAAILRLPAIVAAATDGKVRLQLDVTTDEVPVPETAGWVERYVGPRVNEGRYEAEDKVERGPFESVIVVRPGVGTLTLAPRASGATPVAVVPFAVASGAAEGTLEETLLDGWFAAAEARTPRYQGGVAGITLIRDDWATATAPVPAPITTVAPAFRPTVDIPFVPAAIEGEYAATLGDDPEKGRVLTVTEKGLFRAGGLALPAPAAPLDLGTDGTLRIEARSNSFYPIAFRAFFQGGGQADLVLGDDALANVEKPRAVARAPFAYDGKWQTARFDLRRLGGGKALVGLAVAPSSAMSVAERRARGPISVTLATISLTDEAALEASSEDPTARLAARRANPTAAGLTDVDERVKLNAAVGYQSVKDPAVVPALQTLAADINPLIAEAAVSALAVQGTPEALLAVRTIVRVGTNERARSAAALALSRLDTAPKTANEILPLFANRSWRTRLAAVRALAAYRTPEAGIMRMAMIEQADPEIKLAVAESADPKQDYEARKMLYSVVNEPWDAVRVASALRLVDAAEPSFVAEALKIVRDDSVGARRLFLERLGARKEERFRPTLRIGVTDKDPFARAAALRGLALLGNVEIGEIRPAFEDASPFVQSALLDAAEAGKITLPAEVSARLVQSVDPAVRERARRA